MRVTALFLAVIITLFFGCKSVPKPEEPEESNALTQDEIDIIDEVIDHTIVYDIKLPKEEMQVCINDAFFVYKTRYADSYENDLMNSENYLKDGLTIDEKIISSFIKRNMKRRTVDRDAEFVSDFFWNGDSPEKEYFRMLFSNIGFNENNTEALIYAFVDLPTWKYAKYVYLKKENGIWRYIKSISPPPLPRRT